MKKQPMKVTPTVPLADLVEALKESENNFMSWILDFAKIKHWRVAHFRGAWSKDGERYTTPVQAQGKGFPDLCLVRDKRLIFAELKSSKGKVSPEQYDWLEALGKAGGIEVYTWRPTDRTLIEEILE